MCSGPNFKWLQGSSKIIHFLKWKELKFWKMVVNIPFHDPPKFEINPRSYASGVALQSCYDKSWHWEDIKQIFDVEQIQLGRTWRKEFEDWEAQNTLSRSAYKSLVCNHVLNTIQNIIRDAYIYIKPMYSIEFCIILETYIHMQGSSCSTLTLTLILETQGRN